MPLPVPEFSLRLVDPLFVEPFLTGLAFALLLPLLGCYLRLRDEWLAALALAQTAAAGALLAMLGGLPLLAGGLLAATAAATLKAGLEGHTRARQGAAYAMLLIAGWGVSVLLVANLPLAERLGRALFDGQIYFVERSHLLAAGATLVLALAALWRLARPLLLCHLFPDFFQARGRSPRLVHFAFDLLVAVVLAAATMTIGVMAAFALVFVPPLLAWQWGASWQRSLLGAAAVGVSAYLVAFVIALVADQPFGPVLGVVLVVVAVPACLPRRSSAGE